MKRWLLPALGVSLVVNLTLIGFVVGRASVTGGLTPPPVGVLWMIRALPPETRDAVRPVVRRHMPAIARSTHSARRSRKDLIAVLQQPSINPAELDQSLAALRRNMDTVNGATLDTLREVVPALDQPGRALLAEAFRNPRRHSRRGPRMPHRGRFKDAPAPP